ncbi:MAG: Glycosyltransferase-like protein [Candidatus Gallionella acididurans]|uniref:Glycosyltransferase-like protein n=1 Tax=Candidatus Gallionella acididurans TaxID=1796491 RepID=A0A139BS32_9PROT|nr:MAG: Glycosyltransferase-like protein [Candidatus Gallionella acididurans]
MSDRNKQVWLVLSHGFNMDGRAASQTITDKIPHLLDQGIEPIVISAITGRKDEVIEHHQVLPAGPVALRFDLRHYLKQRISSRFRYRVLMTVISLLLLPFMLVEKLFIRIETHWSWAITVYFTAARIIGKRKPVLVYSTGGAYTAHLAGYWLRLRFGLPWIAEIHDPMIFPGLTKSGMRIRFSGWLEGKICKHADVVWWFTEEALARARARHPELGDRGHCIIPGANAPNFLRAPYRRGKHLVIAHFGSLAETRNLEIFLLGLRSVLEINPQWAEHIRLHLYGGGIDPVSARALRDFPHPGMIELFGRLETDPKTGESGRDQVLKRMNAADCLLLLHGTVPFCEEYIPSKMYEYLWTQRPILALVWHNPQMERMLRELGHWAVKADDPDLIASALEQLQARWMRDDLRDSGTPSAYTTEAATRRIIALAHECIQRG